jgi:hypothetical protein
VYEGADGNLLVIGSLQDPRHYRTYLVDIRRRVVCAAGHPFTYRVLGLALTEDAHPCEFVLDGTTEPPSFNSRLAVTKSSIDFTALHGERVLIEKKGR